MSESIKKTHCAYCWSPVDIYGHNNGCPVPVGTKEAMNEWQRGYRYGFEDNFIPWGCLRNYSLTFQYGWRDGKAKIDRLVDIAAQSMT